MSRLREQVLPSICDAILDEQWETLFDAEVSPVFLTLPETSRLHAHWQQREGGTDAAFRLLCGRLWRSWLKYKKSLGKRRMDEANTVSWHLHDTLNQ